VVWLYVAPPERAVAFSVETRALRAAPEKGAARGEVPVPYWYNHFPDIREVLTWTANHGFRLESHQKCPHYHHVLLRLTSG
jgi:hypothetical protein